MANNLLEMIDPAEDTFGEYVHRTAAKSILEYESQPEYHWRPLLQPTNLTGRAYLRHGLEIINNKYNEAIHNRYNEATYEQYVCKKRTGPNKSTR
jgi:hypothetical protein